MKIKISVISIFKMGVGSGGGLPPPQVFNRDAHRYPDIRKN